MDSPHRNYKRLTPALRMKVVCIYERIKTYKGTAAEFTLTTPGWQITNNGVKKIIQSHQDSPFKRMESATRSGRPRCSSEREDRVIKRTCLADRFSTAPVLLSTIKEHSETFNMSLSTMKNRLQEFGLNGRIARKKPKLTQKHKDARLKFAREHLLWSKEQWGNVFYFWNN
eukprot:GCRY01008453.1.p1 GENE.GCRY01008453.1~~GCRY01008453.1.p1  ORF type:complete len:171 (+),score=8.87 GCRY01008453.1:271-783(+)